MMGDINYQGIIQNAIDSIGREIDPKIDEKDTQTIHLHEVVRCIRRSYYDRIDRKDYKRTGFSDLLSGLIRKMQYGSKPGEYDIGDIKLKGQTDMIVDDSVILFRTADVPPEIPNSSDLLYLNACLWMFNKPAGVLIYITGDRKEVSFSLTKTKKMFEEVIRRIKILNDLLKENKVPIIEPSSECSTCQYYDRCYIPQKIGKPISLGGMLGMDKE